MALAGSGKIATVKGPFRRFTPSPDTPEVAGTEEPQIERAVSPENERSGFFFCSGMAVSTPSYRPRQKGVNQSSDLGIKQSGDLR
jgi:hypothetical protein